MGLENYVGRKIIEAYGVKIENPHIRNDTFALFLVASTMSRISRSRPSFHGFIDGLQIINGQALPKEGAVILGVAPHVNYWDPPETYKVAAVAAHRSTRMIAADYTVDPNIPQDPKKLEARGKKPQSHLMRHVVAFLSSIGGPIPFNRDNNDPKSEEFIRTQQEIDDTLTSGQILAVSLQDTRKNPGEPNPARIGLARIAYSHPNVPVVILGLTGMEHNFGPVVARLSDRFTVAEMGIDPKSVRGLIVVHNKILKAAAGVVSPQAAIDLSFRGKDLRVRNK